MAQYEDLDGFVDGMICLISLYVMNCNCTLSQYFKNSPLPPVKIDVQRLLPPALQPQIRKARLVRQVADAQQVDVGLKIFVVSSVDVEHGCRLHVLVLPGLGDLKFKRSCGLHFIVLPELRDLTFVVNR